MKMLNEIYNEGLNAFTQGDYALADFLWNTSLAFHCASDEESDLIFDTSLKKLEAGTQNVHLYNILSGFTLDFDFEYDYQDIFLWSARAVEIDPLNFFAQRFAGSASYWLGNTENALKYYQQANALHYSPDLAFRIFNIQRQANKRPFTEFSIDFNGDNGIGYYSCGVEIGQSALNAFTQNEKSHLENLSMACYEKAYQLFSDYLEEGKGSIANADGHHFAMCCNNLADIYNKTGKHKNALDILLMAKKYDSFYTLYFNLQQTYDYLGNEIKKAELTEYIVHNFQLDTVHYFYQMHEIVKYYLKTSQYDKAREYGEEAMKEYLNLDIAEQQDPAIMQNYTLIFSNKALADSFLGENPCINEIVIDNALCETPDSVPFILSRAFAFVSEGNHKKALDCYEQAIAFARKQDKNNLPQALTKRGYFYLYNADDARKALLDFIEVEQLNPKDFYCFYYQANCYYLLKNETKTLERIEKAALLIDSIVKQDTLSMSQLYMMQGDTWYDLRKFQNAASSYQQSLCYMENTGVRENMELAEAELNKGKNSFWTKFKL